MLLKQMAWTRMLRRFDETCMQFSYRINKIFFPKLPGPMTLNFEQRSISPPHQAKKAFTLKDIIGDGFLYAVPKKRRSIEKRLSRKFGNPFYVWKLLKPKDHLRVCDACGNYYEVGVLCPNCYTNVIKETKLTQEKIQEKLGLSPVEKDVIVLYKREKDGMEASSLHGKEVIEIDKPRPSWFSKNLLQKTTKTNDGGKDINVKPSELG